LGLTPATVTAMSLAVDEKLTLLVTLPAAFAVVSLKRKVFPDTPLDTLVNGASTELRATLPPSDEVIARSNMLSTGALNVALNEVRLADGSRCAKVPSSAIP